jgi:hypothetical protein
MKIKMNGALLLRGPGTIDGQSSTAYLGGSVRTQEYRERTDLRGNGKFVGRLLFGQEFALCLVD